MIGKRDVPFYAQLMICLLYTSGVVEKVQNSVSLSQVESDAAKTANDHFTGIQDYITELGGRVGKVSEHMQNLYESKMCIRDRR